MSAKNANWLKQKLTRKLVQDVIHRNIICKIRKLGYFFKKNAYIIYIIHAKPEFSVFYLDFFLKILLNVYARVTWFFSRYYGVCYQLVADFNGFTFQPQFRFISTNKIEYHFYPFTFNYMTALMLEKFTTLRLNRKVYRQYRFILNNSR